MFTSGFNFPSVDGLIEGVHYRVVEWNFADGQPVEKQEPEQTVQPVQQNAPAPRTTAAPAAPAQPPQKMSSCAPGEKPVFGVCRKVGGGTGEKDFDSSKKTQQETEGEAEATKQGSDVKNNKAVSIKGKKMGWAIKDGKPVLVEWGSVAGEKKVGPKKPEKPKTPPQQPLNRAGTRTSGLNRDSRDAYARGQEQNATNPNLNAAAQQASRDNAARARGGA